MKYMTAVLALGAVAVAAPAEVEKRQNTCPNTAVNVCCNTVAGINLLCQTIQVGQSCSGTSYCCENGASTGGLINLNLANCVKIL
ncbi:hydrophobin-like protein [Metarhizium robertsii]|uniref:Hydrophobin-like protein n=1 Tax=Metarhizium robertsii TaxID=568076 RepID=A0A014P1Y3_9HYPO|nr:hydrophobin-like protein [Metarhizium robertsii]KFG77522.1 hypothetical protein MANI_122615 [Metarhizium anisopliae]